MKKEQLAIAKNPYDAIPYTSFPFPQTNPSTQRSIAYLFGLNSPDPAKARILELGCASGNNILSIAARYPKSECVGVDLSDIQITEGQQRAREFGIKNLKLEKKSILDITPKFGKFDYIICHGVLSWVPRNVQEKILEICQQNLTENGVAYVSYNTLPGWSSVQALREMMLYHTSHFESPQEKAAQAREMLKFVYNSVKDMNKSYADIIQGELNILANQSDWYLLHDHLEENNIQYYFHEFMEMATKNKLQYLAEVSLSQMFIDNLPAEAAKVLNTSNDIIRSEQYMDYIYNRRFRTTLLCHKDRELKRSLNAHCMIDKYFTSLFRVPKEFEGYKFGSDTQLNFTTASGTYLKTSEPLMIIALVVLAENRNKPMALKEIARSTSERLKTLGFKIDSEENLLNALALNFLKSIFIGGITLHMDEGQLANKVSEKPKAFHLAAKQAEAQEWVTNLRQESVNLNVFDKALLPLLDGKNDIKQLVKILLPDFVVGKLSMSTNDKKIEDIEEIEKKLPELLASALSYYIDCGLLAE